MAEPLATLAELKENWPDLPAEDEADAQLKLKQASIEVRGRFPDIDRRIATGELDRDTVVLVICRMVERAMAPTNEATGNAPANATQMSFTTGAFAQQFTLKTNDGNLYLTKQDLRLLAPLSTDGQFFNLMPK